MREIRFRAWDKKGKGFITGFNMVNFHSYYNEGVEPHIYRYDTEWSLSDIELMQYTGLKDKNGVEIYEGDIICHKRKVEEDWGIDKYIGKVIFTYGRFHMADHVMDEIGNTQYTVGIEVIGNIYENPELLEGSVENEKGENKK